MFEIGGCEVVWKLNNPDAKFYPQQSLYNVCEALICKKWDCNPNLKPIFYR